MWRIYNGFVFLSFHAPNMYFLLVIKNNFILVNTHIISIRHLGVRPAFTSIKDFYKCIVLKIYFPNTPFINGLLKFGVFIRIFTGTYSQCIKLFFVSYKSCYITIRQRKTANCISIAKNYIISITIGLHRITFSFTNLPILCRSIRTNHL